MIDNKGKLFGKINIVDLLVILIIIIAVVLTFIKFNFTPVVSERQTENFKYTVVVKGVRNYSVNAFQIGDEMFEDKTENSIGKIVDIQTLDAERYLVDRNGEILISKVPEHYDLYLTLECDGYKTDKGYETATGESIQLNKDMNIFNKYCQTTLKIKDIN